MKYFSRIKVALKSRKPIKNWYSSLLDYLILKKPYQMHGWESKPNR
jgi:hypothetical protein